ncbi:hypothetical protein SLEP1_g46696 [Rubroshorea leprosula]|uniref:Uncharacterized protein n=1 Tax=Rubroshorea leprosula TaxID=152421 RepID=A0AAV5LQ62_9ROSI|nr:hypothetical protein SLEP1_g46696 [Rubroshorea leprosula]
MLEPSGRPAAQAWWSPCAPCSDGPQGLSGGPPLFLLICGGARGSSRSGVHRGRLLLQGDRRRRRSVSRPGILEPGAISPRVD